MYLTPTELSTHLPQELIDLVDAEDADTIENLTNAIAAAISEAYGYLNRFDTVLIFETAGALRNPILLLYIKDIAIWHYINQSNPNIEMELREKRYILARDWLIKVQSGKITPDLPTPLPDDDFPQNGFFKWGSQKRRITSY